VPTQNLNRPGEGKGGRVEAAEAGPPAGYALEGAPRTAVTPATTEGDVVIKEFKFRDGETIPELRLHYATLGKPTRDGRRARGQCCAAAARHGAGPGAQFSAAAIC